MLEGHGVDQVLLRLLLVLLLRVVNLGRSTCGRGVSQLGLTATSEPLYRGTSLIRNTAPVGPYSSICPGPHGGPGGEGCFLRARYP